jgi:cell division protein FtsL
MLGEILFILIIAVAAMVGAFLLSVQVRAATQNKQEQEPEPEVDERDASL